MKTKNLIVLMAASAVLLAGCKGANEKSGDSYLEEGRYQNAINSYLTAKGKGNVSNEFYDNFTLAIAKRAEVESKKAHPVSASIYKHLYLPRKAAELT